MQTKTITRIYDTLADTYPLFEDSDDEWMKHGLSATPFRALVSVCLSTMTISSRTIKACLALYDRVGSFEEILDLDDDELRELIRPVAHYNRKTVSLKKMSRQIIEDHSGEIPREHAQLMELAGVGRKCADIMMNFTFGTPTIAVDTHVHRVVNRLGMVDTTTDQQTADELTRITPERFRQHAHEWLIQHGMKCCVARKPKCHQCPISQWCNYAAR